MAKEVGDDGFTDIEGTVASERYSNYTVYQELEKLRWDKAKAANHMSITVDELEDIIEEYGPGQED